MSIRIGYLLPTRERVMAGQPQASSLLELAGRAERLGFDSVWVGDSLLARPRHEPLTLLAAVASRVRRVDVGTAVLLPALRNPVLLAHQVATLDQVAEGRLILGVGIAADVPNIRQEFTAAGVPFEKRVGRLLEGLRLARLLWSGKPVDWDGRWKVEQGILGPTEFPFEVDRLVALPEELDDLQPFRRNVITAVMIQHRGAEHFHLGLVPTRHEVENEPACGNVVDGG